MTGASVKAIIAELEDQCRIVGARAARFAGDIADRDARICELEAELSASKEKEVGG